MDQRRVFFSILLLLSVFFAPFWLSAIMALAGMFIFPKYWEGVVLLFFSDLLYGVEKERFQNLPYLGLFGSVLAIIAIEVLKKKLRFYQ